ncbi:MAG: FAD-binding protein, partial [Caulobacteraceae bacterium]
MSAVVDRLVDALGRDKVVTDPAGLAERRHDYWVLSHLRDLLGRGPPAPLAVVRPTAVADVQAALRIANDTGTPVIPFGLGSGVVGGVEASPAAIVLDMGAMASVR